LEAQEPILDLARVALYLLRRLQHLADRGGLFMKKVVVLGTGMVGSAIAIDLSRQYDVTAADFNENALAPLKKKFQIKTIVTDLSKRAVLQKLVAPYDLVVGAVPGFMGFETVKTVIERGKNIVDISFFVEDPFALDRLAKSHGVTAVVDCGIAPGMCNLLLGYHHARMKVETYECLVGGLPVRRSWPYQYKAPFSPIDVIEEYTRPARYVENGKLVTKAALSEPEHIDFDGIGTLEAFNTDGLRTLLKTMQIPNMREKTLRYPGHIEYMRVLRETGFFSKEPLTFKTISITPLEVTARLLFPHWKLDSDEPEFTIMRVSVKGTDNNKKQNKAYVYELLDRFDEKTKTSSMARTTGYTCAAVATLVLEGAFTQKGIVPPEYIGANEECFRAVLAYQQERNIRYREKERIEP
jgi:saccharopine dehydrogenase-like NADP-dependent oxidoreductase